MTVEEEQKLNPGLSALLSFLFNGLGQIYNGQIKKGLIIMSGSTIGMILMLMGAVLVGHWLLLLSFPSPSLLWQNELIWGVILFVVGLIVIAILGFYSINDAYNMAQKRLSE